MARTQKTVTGAKKGAYRRPEERTTNKANPGTTRASHRPEEERGGNGKQRAVVEKLSPRAKDIPSRGRSPDDDDRLIQKWASYKPPSKAGAANNRTNRAGNNAIKGGRFLETSPGTARPAREAVQPIKRSRARAEERKRTRAEAGAAKKQSRRSRG
jgi:hypothetical protein